MAYHSLTRQLERARERLERDGAMANGLSQPNKISGERLERDVAMADGLTQTNKIASKSWRELERDQREMELWLMAYHSLRRQLERAIRRERAREEIQSYLDKLMTNGQTDRQTDGLTELFLKSLLRLRKRKLERVREHQVALERAREEIRSYLDNLMTVYPHLLQYNHIFILQLDYSISTSFSVYPHLCQYIHIYLEYIHIFLGLTELVLKSLSRLKTNSSHTIFCANFSFSNFLFYIIHSL